MTLTGSSTYAGDTIIRGGTLQGGIADNANLRIAAGASYDGANAARSLNILSGGGVIRNTNGLSIQSGDFGGVIDDSNTGGLTKTGTGALTLTGSNTYAGMTTVQSGTLALGSGGALISNRLTLLGGAIFDRNGQNHSLDHGELYVDGSSGQGAIYKGDLSAQDAALRFISSAPPETVSLLEVDGDANLSRSVYQVGLKGDAVLPAGSRLTLVEVTAGHTLTAGDLTQGSIGEIRIGSTVAQGVDLVAMLLDGCKLIGVTRTGQADVRAKALSEGYLGGLTLTLMGADLAADHGVEAAARAAQDGGTVGFGAFGGGSLKYRTGSHVDANGFSVLAGLARDASRARGRLTTGFFFEYGNGSYDTYNSFANAADAHGGGDARYAGGGLLGRLEYADNARGRFYAEASARLGRLRNDYSAIDLLDAAGRAAAYDSSALYYGLHLGAGYARDLADGASLELYGKYFWTRQEGDSLRLSTGESVRFDDADSSRLRLGLRYARTLSECARFYVGAAWEHEFDGRARATTNGCAIDAPGLKGDTGIGELGLSFSLSGKAPLTFELGLQGYAGRREGLTGTAQIKWCF